MATTTVISPSGKTLLRRGTWTTTSKESADAKIVRISQEKMTRLEENRTLLADRNVGAFLKAIAEAEGGGYDFKYGAIKGKRNDPWRFSDFSTHPGPGFGGSTTAAGMYQITIATWRQHGGRMALTDFSPATQDLIAVEILRSLRLIDKIKSGDIAGAIGPAARTWAALPMGPGLGNAHPPQPFAKYEEFFTHIRPPGGQGNEIELYTDRCDRFAHIVSSRCENSG
jgi:muramidase (phage lysozyme)